MARSALTGVGGLDIHGNDTLTSLAGLLPTIGNGASCTITNTPFF